MNKAEAQDSGQALVQMYQSGFLDGYAIAKDMPVVFSEISEKCKKSFDKRFMRQLKKQIKKARKK